MVSGYNEDVNRVNDVPNEYKLSVNTADIAYAEYVRTADTVNMHKYNGDVEYINGTDTRLR